MSCVHDERNGDADTTGFAEGQSWRRKNQRGPKPEKDKVRKRSNKNSAFTCLAQVIKEYVSGSADAASPLPITGCM